MKHMLRQRNFVGRSLMSNLTGLVLLATSHARAQATDRALAEELFREGRALMDQQRVDEACPKFAESQRLDPSTGTLLNLATCHEQQGKFASAWSEYSEVATMARRDGRSDRMEHAEARRAALEAKLSRLTIELAPGSEVSGLTIRLDGAELGRPSIGAPLPLDPGPHTLSVTAPDKRPWEVTVRIGGVADTQRLAVPALADAPKQAAPSAAPSTTRSSARSSNGTQRYVAYALGGLGVVGVGLGSFFGLRALSKNSDSNSSGCSGNLCSESAANTRHDAIHAGNISTLAFAIGGVALGSGLVLFFTAPRAPKGHEASARAELVVLPAGTALKAVW
jgi:hypothetical protein